MWHNKSKSTWRSLVLLIAAMLVVMTVAAGCGKKNETNGEGNKGAGQGDKSAVIATYKGGQVTEAEFDKYASFFSLMNPQYGMLVSIPQYKEQFLKEFIGYRLLSDKVSDKVKEEVGKQADEFEKQLTEALKTNEELKKILEPSGLTEKEARDFYVLVFSVMKNAEESVTDAQIKTEFEKDPEGFTKVQVRHILVAFEKEDKTERTDEEAKKRANEAKDKLKGGTSWDEIAKEYSDDPGSKEKGGLYELKEAKTYVPEFKDASLKQPLDEIGEPVKTEYGYHVIKVEKREAQSVDKLSEETKAALKQQVSNESISKFMSDELPGLIEKIDLPQPPSDEEKDGNAKDQAPDNSGKENKDDAAKNNSSK
ncbi:peptidylprolyl isomerase [Paenibacillus sp. GCM10012307]|uniref:Peptidylprolyl isomerase n=1 Tax=Paenibacillus roseus TaxID=2798579 RepID=A0A934IXW7_9BACL|nr:peptidylprolyl isomerase [Paenibacillus roseus]MBJ6361277.1 peptidylprolyl isomerase [Paenibacillus roseus]